MFLFLARFHPTNELESLQLDITDKKLIQLDITDKKLIIHAKEKNIRLPVAVRGSKTPVRASVRIVQYNIVPSPLTSDVNIPAHVPIHQTTRGFVTVPFLMASQILYSSVPPT